MARITFEEASNFDKSKFTTISEKVESNGQIVDEVVNEIVAKYTQPLDNIIAQAHEALQQSKLLSDAEIEYFTLTIPLHLYFVSSSSEYIGVRADVAKMIRQRMYISARQNATGTVEDKNAEAEKAVIQETLTSLAYERANKLLRSKSESAQDVYSAFKKVMSRRIEEIQLTRFGGNPE